MRSLALIAITLVVLTLIGGLYILVQPKAITAPSKAERMLAAAAENAASAASRPTTAPLPNSKLQAGEEVWVKVPDEKTGRLAWQMRTARYDPQPDNSVKVDQPEAEFFFDEGETIVRIVGSHGRVVVPGDLSNPDRMRGAGAAPSRGELYDVTISVFRGAGATRPWIVCRMNNVAFDNDTFRIATEAFKQPDGAVVPADQVPVEVRGDEIDFDGRGLVIRWNDRDRRLQSLEIAHGESLTVKSEKILKGLSPDIDAPKPGRVSQVRPPQSRDRGIGEPILAADVIAPTTRHASDSPVYRAVFEGGTRITQGNKQLCEADNFSIDFPAAREGQPGGSSEKPSAEAGKPRKSTATTRPAPATAAARQSDPVVVHWPGRLVVTPIETDPPKLAPGEFVANLSSNDRPIVINHEIGEVRCASLSVSSQFAVIRNSPLVPVVTIKLPDGQILYTSDFRYSDAESQAVASGPSRIEVLIKDEKAGTASLATAKWNKQGVITIAKDSRGRKSIEHAVLSGEVSVEHPQFRLSSNELTTVAAPPTAGDSTVFRPASFDAVGNARCEVFADQKSGGKITADRLAGVFDVSDPRAFSIKTVTADGNIDASGADGELHAGHVVADIAPTTQPDQQVQIAKLVAQQDVRFKSKDFSGAAGQLTATQVGDDYDVLLQGQPAASVGTAEAMLHGPIIKLQPGRQTAQVVGAGSLNGARAMSEGGKPTPFELTWQDRFMMDGASNHGEINGAVTLHSTGEDGSVNTATGQRLLVTFGDDPAAKRNASTAPTDGLFGGVGAMTGKTVTEMTLAGDTEVKSLLNDQNGKLLRRAHIFAPKILIEPLSQRVSIPSAGRLLFEDLQPRSRPTTGPATPLGDFSGATAFEWKDRLTFDQQSDRVEMLGDVVIVHQQDETSSDPFRLEAPRVFAEFEREKSATSRPADAALPISSVARVRSLGADGGARFISPKIQFDAERMSYDPSKEILMASGTERMPVQLYDEKGLSAGTVQEVWWNTRTQSIGLRDVQGQIRR